MCKAVDPSMCITGIRVLEKEGGKTGHWQAQRDQVKESNQWSMFYFIYNMIKINDQDQWQEATNQWSISIIYILNQWIKDQNEINDFVKESMIFT